MDAARQYGLIESSAKVNQERCALLLERGRLLGYVPKPMKELFKLFAASVSEA